MYITLHLQIIIATHFQDFYALYIYTEILVVDLILLILWLP